MNKPYDFKKEQKTWYAQLKQPQILEIPKRSYLMVEGCGDPNTSQAYKEAMQLLYSMIYTIKMKKMKPVQPKGYYDFVVPPLEGFWWNDQQGAPESAEDKTKFSWISFLQLPDFVDDTLIEEVKKEAYKKNPELDYTKVTKKEIEEGLCAQIFHMGSYDDEPKTLQILHRYLEEQGYICDISENRRHHEIYFNDPNKVPPDRLKTIIRIPIKKK